MDNETRHTNLLFLDFLGCGRGFGGSLSLSGSSGLTVYCETGLDSDVTQYDSHFFGSFCNWLLGLGGLYNLLGNGCLGSSSSLILSRLLSSRDSLKRKFNK